MKKKILAGLALAVSAAGVGAGTAQAAEVWYGEFQTIPNLPAGTILNIDMYDGNLGGVDPVTRCLDMGGTPHWHYTWHYTCLNVDY